VDELAQIWKADPAQTWSDVREEWPDEPIDRYGAVDEDIEVGDEEVEVEGEFDLRIKGVLDDGADVHEVIFDQEATEELTDITLDEAQEMAMDALDTSVVADEMREKTLGYYYRVAGPTLGRYVLANDVEQLTETVDPEAVLIKARSI
jgi:ssDNA-binding replication factor A large subunit